MPLDYRNFESGQLPTSARLGHWWRERGVTAAASLSAAGKALKHNDEPRRQSLLRHAKLYGGMDFASFGIRDYMRSSSEPRNRITLNVISSCIDALTAKIAKNKPRPSFQTDGANFIMQRKARKLDHFMRGLFYQTGIYQETHLTVLDALIFGTGVIKVFIDVDGKVCAERQFIGEIFVDDADGIYGKPRQILQRKLISREVALATYGGKEGCPEWCAILAAKAPEEAASLQGFGDLIEIWEGWHLPSSKKSKDGMRLLACEGAVLEVEENWKGRFPFAFLKYRPRVLGFWSQGLAELLTGIQVEINRLLRSITDQLRRKGRSRIFVPTGSQVVPSHLTNAIGDIVYYSGNSPPVVDNTNVIASEEFVQLDRLYQRAYQEAGISELSVASKKPSGLDAAVALREFSDIETERFAMFARGYEQFFLDIAEAMIEVVREAPSYSVITPDKKSFREYSWKDIDLERDAFTMQMFPVSSLPSTPAYRRQTVRELMDDGFIENKAEARRALDFPDLEDESNLSVASVDMIDKMISDILDQDKPKFTPPEEYQDLPHLIERTTAAYYRARIAGADEDRLELLRQLIDQAVWMMEQAAQASQQQGPGSGPQMPGGPPPGGGGPMPPELEAMLGMGGGAPPPGPGAPPAGPGAPPPPPPVGPTPPQQ